MFGTIRKHQTWLWVFLIAIMIFGMVIWQSSTTSSMSNNGPNFNYGSIDRKKITQTQYINARREAELRYLLNYGEWPGKGQQRAAFDAERETYQRLFLIYKLEQLDITVDEQSVTRTAENILMQWGKGRPVPFDTFVKQVLAPNASADDFERFLQHELGIQQLLAVAGLSGNLTTPQEAQSLYEREHRELATEAVFFNASNYLAGVSNAAPATLTQFYTNQEARYRVPDQVQVSYVEFIASNYVAEADQEMAKLTNLNAIVENLYTQRGTNYYPNLTPDQAKQKIREEVFHEVLLGAANKKANEFANDLYNMEPQRPENLATIAQKKGLTVHVSEPFDKDNGPTNFDGGPNFAKAAFALSPTNEPFYEQPLVGADSVYVIAYNKQIPSEIPPLNAIRERVANDYKYVQAIMLARQTGARFAQSASNELARGKSFAAICVEAKVRPITVPPFSLSTRELPEIENHLSLNQYKQLTFGTPVGKVSEFNPTPEGGAVVYVQQKLPIDVATMQKDLPGYIKAVRQQREQEAFSEWFRTEAEKSMRDTPLMQPRQPAPGQPQQ